MMTVPSRRTREPPCFQGKRNIKHTGGDGLFWGCSAWPAFCRPPSGTRGDPSHSPRRWCLGGRTVRSECWQTGETSPTYSLSSQLATSWTLKVTCNYRPLYSVTKQKLFHLLWYIRIWVYRVLTTESLTLYIYLFKQDCKKFSTHLFIHKFVI